MGMVSKYTKFSEIECIYIMMYIGPTKTVLNSYGNYLPSNWNEESGCADCWQDMISLAEVKVFIQSKYIAL